jgi:hypothetical protein
MSQLSLASAASNLPALIAAAATKPRGASSNFCRHDPQQPTLWQPTMTSDETDW